MNIEINQRRGSDLRTDINEYECYNAATVSGKIIYTRPLRNATLFTISSKNEKTGQLTPIAVYFEGVVGTEFSEKFKIGDYVIVTGVVQNYRNRHTSRDEIRVFGLTMAHRPKFSEYTGHKTTDMKTFNIRGRVTRTLAISDSIALIFVNTVLQRKFKNPLYNPNDEESVEFFSKRYISNTPIAIYRGDEGEHDAKDIAAGFTVGTWVHMSGWINTRKSVSKNTQQNITEQQLVANKITIIGELQLPSEK